MFESSSKSVESLSLKRDRELIRSSDQRALSDRLGEWFQGGRSWLATHVLRYRISDQVKGDYYSQLMACHSGELITTHSANGETLHASMASIAVTGATDPELLGSGLLNKLHLQDRIVFLKTISEVANDGKEQSTQLRLRNSIEAGSPWRILALTFRRNETPHLPGEQVVGIITDVTDQLERENQHLQAIAVAKEQDDDKRLFLATMSHELRTPLNAIIGFADILDQAVFGELPHQKHREHVSMIKQGGEHLLSVVNDLLDVSRLRAGKYELSHSRFEPHSVVDTAVSMLQPSADAGGVSLTKRISENLPEIYADRRSCQQILINIVSNAIKFTPSGGVVSVDVRAGNETIDMTVTDTGIGIAEDFLPLIGQPFVQAEMTTSRRYEGSGLGLSVVKGLVELHGGKLDISSELSKGTEVVISMPLKPKCAKPIPSGDHEHLVHLSNVKPAPAVEDEYHRVSEGEYRARVSA